MTSDVKDKKNKNTETLIADNLFNDPRVAEGKQLLIEAVQSHQRGITGIRPPINALKQSYEETLASFAKQRGAKLWFPFLGSGIGSGALVELADGSIKYDFICGIGAHYSGHSHPDIIASGLDAAISDVVIQGNLQQNLDTVELSTTLIKISGFDHCFLTTSGAMANENALKMAFQKNYPAKRILAFDRCFVGRTLATSQITDKAIYREGLPSNFFIDYLPFFDSTRPEESTATAIDMLKKYLHRYPGQYAIMCFEFVQGEGGFYEGTSAFFKAIMTILKENDIAIFADEVQTFGRLPELFAFQYYGLHDYIDIASVGKLSLVCATLFRDKYKPKPGLLSQTFTSSTAAIKASKTILDHLQSGNYYGPDGKVKHLHDYFVSHLEKLASKYPSLIKGPFGLGCMVAFTPFDGNAQGTIDFVHRLFNAGVMSFIAGANPTRVRFLIPAMAVTFEDIDQVVTIIEKTLVESKYS